MISDASVRASLSATVSSVRRDIDVTLREKAFRRFLAMGVRHADAEDGAQEVMLALLTTRVEIRDEAMYALGIAHNMACRARWRTGVDRRHLDLSWAESYVPSPEPDPFTRMARIELIALANSVLRAMPERRREILRRYYFLGEPWARVCEALDITSTVFRLEQSRARAQLLERLVSATKPRKRALTTKTVPT